MSPHPAASGPCQGQAAKSNRPTGKSKSGKHGDGTKSRSYGHDLRTKLDSICRIAFINPNGIGKFSDSTRSEEVVGFVKKHGVDALMMAELNIDWRTVPVQDTLFGRTDKKFQTRPAVSVAHNTTESKRSTSNQRGGTAVWAMDKLSLCKESVGQDATKLGRWSWIRIKGKDEIHTRIVSVYFPNKPGDPTDRGTYNQQRDYFLSQGNATCPQKQFWIDLKADIAWWLDQGDQLIIGGDWNNHIRHVNQHLSPLGLAETVTTTHGLNEAPNTQIRGKDPIDGIFTTPALKSVSCGYLPFHSGTGSDHRIVWADFDIDAILGFQMHNIHLPRARRLLLKDPRIWKKYNHLLNKWETKHKLIEKAEKLLSQASYPITAEVKSQLEAIDKIRVQGMIYAEKRCRKIRHGKHPWSPELSRARRLVKLWAMMRDRHRYGAVGARAILRLLTKLGMTVDLGMDIDTILSNLDIAKKEYISVKKNAHKLRESYLRELARALADNDETKIASKIRQLFNIEEQRRVARAIKYTTNKLFGSGTSRVIIPDSNGGNCEVTDRYELEREIIKENLRKYHRTESYCPLLHGQLLEDIGLCGDGPRVPDILNGTYVCPPGTPEGTVLFIQSLKRPNLTHRAKEKAKRSNIDEFRHAWGRKKERSSSYGPLHYGHYKSACRDDRLGYLHYLMAEIMMQTGCYLDRHRKGVDVMLLKAAGDYRLHRLRTICLFDAEFNMNNDRVSKAGLQAALELGEIADEQYSRPCRSAIDHVVNRRLTFDYFAYCKRPFGICSCDLAGCYDRIVHAAASLALQRLGVPLSRITGMFDTIQRLVKQVRTAYGDSDDTYGGDDVEYPYLLPPQGVYQGNCNGPPVWSIISSTVFSVLRKRGFGVKFITAISHEIYHLCGFAYVDDSDLIQDGTCAFSVAKDMQLALDTWSSVMEATGQALAPKKSWWYLVDFVWENGEWRYNNIGERLDLIAYDTDGAEVSLKRLMHSEGTKMLGVYLAPDGSKTKQLEYMVGKATEWADCIRVGHLGRVETRVALKTCIWKTLLYPLPATSFTEQELNKVIWPILDVALPRIGVCRNIALALRYGPKHLGGLSLVNLLLDQGIQKVLYLVDQPWKNTPTGKLISANAQALSIDCGIVGPLFEQPSHSLSWSTVKDSWLRSAWEFMSVHEITISNIGIPFPSLQRHNDVPIMSTIQSRLADLTPADLTKINICRLHMRAVTLSDISDAAGTHIRRSAIPLSRSQRPVPSFGCNYTWPVQPCPPSSFWLLWSNSLLRAFCIDDNLALCNSLGDWTDPLSTERPSWDWYCHVHPTKGNVGLWHVIDSTWYLHPILHRGSRRNRKFSILGIKSISATSNQSTLFQVDVSCVHNKHYTVNSFSPYPVVYDTCDPAGIPPGMSMTLEEEFLYHISTLKESSWLLRRFSFTGDINKLLMDFCNGDALSVSDGSYSDCRQCASASWAVESIDRSAKIRGDCIAPGTGKVQNSYRAELTGILGLTATLWSLYQIALSRNLCLQNCDDLVVGCDGYSALQKSLMGYFERATCKHKHFDLTAAIRGFWIDMACDSFPVHIDSHKDEHFPYYALSRLEQMNVDMDRAAKKYLASYHGTHELAPFGDFHFGFPTLRQRGLPIQTEAYKTLTANCTRHLLLQYWQKCWKLSDYEFSSLALDPLERAFASCDDSAATFASKWLGRQINLGTRASTQSLRRKGQLKYQCPRCKHWKDDMAHVFRCPKARPTVDIHLDSLKEYLVSLDTDPGLIDGIMLCTTHWLRQSRARPSSFLSHLPSHIQTALYNQYTFGWLRFFNGLHLSCLTDVQASYFQSLRSGRSAAKWHGQFIRELWKLPSALYSERSDAVSSYHEETDPDHPAVQPARTAALAELSSGRGSLPVLFHQYFSISPTSLFRKNVASLRKWLYVVRLNREACNDPLTVTDDDFSKDGQFRLWLTRR